MRGSALAGSAGLPDLVSGRALSDQNSRHLSIVSWFWESAGFLRWSWTAWNHIFNLIGVSLTKPYSAVNELRHP